MSDPMLRLKAIEKTYNAGQKGEVRVLREAGGACSSSRPPSPCHPQPPSGP